MSSDFDEIFGDLKEDQHVAPSLTSDFDADSIFGDLPSLDGPTKVADTSIDKPAAPVQQSAVAVQEPPKTDNDEFLSWLDDGGSKSAGSETAPSFDTVDLGDSEPPAAAEVPVAAPSAVEEPPQPPHVNMAPVSYEISLDDDDTGLEPEVAVAAPSIDQPDISSVTHEISLDDDDSLEPATTASSAPPSMPEIAPVSHEISLDDDDDDFLEKIVENANRAAKQAGSRDSSASSLPIKSHQHHAQAPSIDVAALLQTYRQTGKVPPAARLALWQHCVGLRAPPSEPPSMYALQTTPRDLPSQALLRKEVESVCAAVFASASHRAAVESAEDADDRDGSHLLFLDNAEILLTFVCKSLDSDYGAGWARALAPLLAASGSDPLRLEVVSTLTKVCAKWLPHWKTGSAKSLSRLEKTAGARRPLLKPLLLYHAPKVARHLEEHFPAWTDKGGALPDSWLGSLFESSTGSSDIDLLLPVWDCCLLLEALASSELAALGVVPAIAPSFVALSLVIRAEKPLLRMEGEQLRHCMASALLDALRSPHEPLVAGVASLMEATPPSACVQLATAKPAEAAPPTTLATPSAPQTASTASSSMAVAPGMLSLFAASANGVKELSTAVIDMPGKLLTTITMSRGDDATGALAASARELFFLHAAALAVPARALVLPAHAVIPSVFRSFQAPLPAGSPRFFVVDCRASTGSDQGEIPTAFKLDPDVVDEQVLAALEPLAPSAHLAVMGSGLARVADELRNLPEVFAKDDGDESDQQAADAANSPFRCDAALLDAFAQDEARVQAAVELLGKRGFARVSVLQGGFAAAHALLAASTEGFGTHDLVDHDAPRCVYCRHECALAAAVGTKRESVVAVAPVVTESDHAPAVSASAAPPAAKTASGTLDAKALFDSRAPPAPKYLSSFAGALKTGSKTLLNPADSLKESTKWLMKKSTPGEQQSSPGTATATATATATTTTTAPSGIAGLNKLRNSLVFLGNESLDMLKKAEQAATSKTRLPFGASSSLSPTSTATPSASASGHHSSPAAASSASNERHGSFQPSEDEVFTIDDDEEEQDDFVGGSGASSIAATRNGSFSPTSPVGDGGVVPTFALHHVSKGGVKELVKGMHVSRSQMLPVVESPFFSGYKKKKAQDKTAMLPRRLVLAEGHLLVLKAERGADDVYLVKSRHPLAHLARMTCLKKNALMVTLYYKWTPAGSSDAVERRNAYEVQQRDEFIRAVKAAMDKL